MTPAERVLAMRRAQRQSWVEVAPAANGRPARRVQIIRPTETEQPQFLRAVGDKYQWSAELEHVQRFVTDWDGYTEADLVGPAGGSDPVPFSPQLWADVCADSAKTTVKVAQALLDVLSRHAGTSAEDAKN